jgi:secernin
LTKGTFMCDTFVALGNSTLDGSVILGKNSDREPNEAHEIVVIPAKDHAPGSLVDCTYTRVPQVPHTFAVLLAKPFWIWGAEMGINEHGVAIGNEAIFTRVPHETGQRLIGMDFIRLALERSKTAWEALQTITQLLEAYGQGGNCGFTHPMYYDNSYILADPNEAWVLETAGRQWAAEKVKTVRSISNSATIGTEWDAASKDLVHYAVDRGWCKGRDDFHFAHCYSDFLYTTLSDSRSRQTCTTQLLQKQPRTVTVQTAMEILRSHGISSSNAIQLDRSLLGSTVCMHAGAGPVRGSQSVGSLVAHLTSQQQTAWVTGTSAPCSGIFKPIWLEAGFPLSEPSPTGKFDSACLWWRHELLHRLTLHEFDNLVAVYQADRDALEADFVALAAACPPVLEALRELSASCFTRAERATDTWLERVCARQKAQRTRFYYSMAWNSFNRAAGLDGALCGYERSIDQASGIHDALYGNERSKKTAE